MFVINFSLGVISHAIYILIIIIQLLIFLRAIVSWFPMQNGNPIYSYLVSLTEPFVYPVRQLLNKSSIGSNMPIDLSIIIVYFILEIIKAFFR